MMWRDPWFVHCTVFTMATVTNDHDLGGLNTKHSSLMGRGQKPELKVAARLRTLWKVEFGPFLLLLLVASGISWLVTTPFQSLPSSSSHLLLCLLNVPLCLSCEDTCGSFEGPPRLIPDYHLISESLTSPPPRRLSHIKWHSEVQGSSLISLRTTIQTTTYVFPDFSIVTFCITVVQYHNQDIDVDTIHCFYSDFFSLTCTHLLLCALIPFVTFVYPPVSTTRILCVALL